MQSNLLKCDPRKLEALQGLFPDRIISRGPITFFGPFSDEEENQACALLGMRQQKVRKSGPHYRDGNYYAAVKIQEASYDELMEIFTTFLKEREKLIL